LKRKLFPSAIALAVSAALGASAATAQTVYVSPMHTFSINDIQGGFDGTTYGPAGAVQLPSILCGTGDAGSPACPAGVVPIVDKTGVTLYPMDTEFGFYVVDFVGAQVKTRDGDYLEGFAGNILDGDTVVGVKLSDSSTDTYKVKTPLGTWCAGLGGNSVKCSTEHYTVLEHVLSCHETIPYYFADPVTGVQGIQSTPDDSLTLDCATTDLDDQLYILTGGVPGERLTDATPGVQMDANDNTSVLDDIAVSADYSVTLKDDGKPLYRWGGQIKRPNDIRMYARLALPEEWKARDLTGALVNDFVVTKARLVVNHWITNNPNDQLRPEDLENEAATGRIPDRLVTGTGATEVWQSTKPCYEGDADLVEGVDATLIGSGTYFKNMPFALDPTATPGTEPGADPYAFSADLTGAITNGYYTTIERDPFEWSYLVADADDALYDFVGSPLPDDTGTLGTLVSGPRWRLKANKFGQDIPGLEIPLIECSAPPFEQSNLKYEVGVPTTVVINLLDWDESEGPSPMATSKGWVDSLAGNEFITITDTVTDADGETRYITSNGLPMSDDFDLAVYVKGDKKPTAVYNATLEIEYEGAPVVTPVCGEPTWSATTDNAMFVWNECAYPKRWHMRAVRGGAAGTVFDGDVTSINGFTKLLGVKLETNDVVLPAPPVRTVFAGPIDYALTVYPGTFDGLDFVVGVDATGAYDGCFNMTAPTDAPVLVGATRVPVAVPFSLATFGACTQ